MMWQENAVGDIRSTRGAQPIITGRATGKHKKKCRQALVAKTSLWMTASKETETSVPKLQGTELGQGLGKEHRLADILILV